MSGQDSHTADETHAGTADTGHAESSNPLLNPDPGLAIWTVITFVILLVILRKLAWGPMLEALDAREKAIRDSLAEAEKARAEASTSIEQQQKLLDDARRDAQDLLATSRTDAERAREESLAKARAEGERIIASGKQAIEQEKRAALAELRTAAVDIAVEASSKLLRKRIDDAASKELVATYIQELSEEQ